MADLDDIARTFESVTRSVTLAGRTLLPVDTNPVPDEWEHITKIDPEDEKKLPLLFPLYLQHTGALEVGGSRDVTGDNTEETLELVSGRPRPSIQEPSGVRQVTERTRELTDFFAVPQVLNGDSEAIVGTLGAGIEYLQEELGPSYIREKLPIPLGDSIERRIVSFFSAWTLEKAIFEAYIIMNLDSAAAREGNVTEEDLLSPAEAKQRALVAENHFESAIVYLEYSGTFGGEEAAEILDEIDGALSWSRLWYGGGLDSRENAQAMLDAGADAIVVGNVFHEIAEEEVEISERAIEALDAGATRDAVASWLDDEIDVNDTNAASYLSTITDVSNPEGRAREYLLTTIRARLAVQDAIDELDGTAPSNAEAIRSALDDVSIPGRSDVSDVLDGEDLLVKVLLGLLAERYDVEYDGLPVDHVSFDLD